MTNDKTLPEDEAGDETLASTPQQDVEAEITDIDGDEDISFEADAQESTGATAVAPEDLEADDSDEGIAGEDLAVDTEDEDLEDYEIVDQDAEELLDADETVDDTPDKGDPEDVVIDDEEELAEAEAVAAKAKSSRPVKRKVTTAPVKKDKPTPKQSAAKGKAVAKQRTTPGTFISQCAAELKKVIWPNGDQMREYYLVVLIFVLFIIALVSLLDFGFGWLLLKWLGHK